MDRIDIRLYDKTTGARKPFPSDKVTAASWELIEAGFYSIFNLTLERDILVGYTDIAGGDRLEIWVDGERRYRGYVAQPENNISIEAESGICGYGRFERLNTIIIRQRYVAPGGTDIADFVTQIANDYLVPRIPGLVLDIETTGYDTETFAMEGSNAKSVLNRLIELCGNQCYWGIDVDPATDNDRFFFRVKDTDTERYKIVIGDRLEAYMYPPDYSKIINCVRLTGADAAYPNLVANPSFEEPAVADETNGNLLQNPGFEEQGGSSSDSAEY